MAGLRGRATPKTGAVVAARMSRLAVVRMMATQGNRGRRMKTTKGSPRDIDEYIGGLPRDVQKTLKQIRATIKETAPEAEEAIKYRIPTFVLNENLVHFAAFRNHIGFYPTPSAIEAFREELSSYKSAKGSVQFPFDKPMPLSLIRRIVKTRVKDVRAKSKAERQRR